MDRIGDGLEPACVKTCPSGALSFDKREAVIAKANEAEAEGAYLYGRDEVGGTSWIYVSDVPFDELGFPAVGTESYPSHSTGIWGSQIATIVVGAAALGLYSLYIRRKRIEGEQR
jgi:formate dehydrogenase iron-sulfur subunit